MINVGDGESCRAWVTRGKGMPQMNAENQLVVGSENMKSCVAGEETFRFPLPLKKRQVVKEGEKGVLMRLDGPDEMLGRCCGKQTGFHEHVDLASANGRPSCETNRPEMNSLRVNPSMTSLGHKKKPVLSRWKPKSRGDFSKAMIIRGEDDKGVDKKGSSLLSSMEDAVIGSNRIQPLPLYYQRVKRTEEAAGVTLIRRQEGAQDSRAV